MQEVDIVIVGAGAAGIAAARRAGELGLGVALLEAKGRVGGRAHTDIASLGAPWDRGCQILHSADVNPLTEHAERLGFPYLKGYPRPRRTLRRGSWADPEEVAALDDYCAACWAAVRAAGAAGEDVPIATVVDRHGRFAPIFDYWCSAIMGVDPDRASTLDYARYRDSGENWPLGNGYGALIAALAGGLPVRLDTPVMRIDHGGKSGVRVATPRGALTASAVLVTVSTGVLHAETIRFDPPLPEWKRAAIAALPLGSANKVALALDPGTLDAPANSHAQFDVPGGGICGMQIRPFGHDFVSVYLGGGFSDRLEAAGEAAMIAVARDGLRQIFGANALNGVRCAAATRWSADPDIRGAYSAARPGEALRRIDLGLPVADRVFFAGEATSPEFFTTAHGAWASGIAQIDAIAKLLAPKAARA